MITEIIYELLPDRVMALYIILNNVMSYVNLNLKNYRKMKVKPELENLEIQKQREGNTVKYFVLKPFPVQLIALKSSG